MRLGLYILASIVLIVTVGGYVYSIYPNNLHIYLGYFCRFTSRHLGYSAYGYTLQ